MTIAGVYYFNLSGTAFSTYVNNTGWVLLANDSGGAVTILPTVTALTNAKRGVLASAVLASLTSTTQLKLTTSDGNIDCTSSDVALISRLTHDSSLNMGNYNNDLSNNSSWTGNGQAYVRGPGAGCTGTGLGTHPDSCMFWPCGDGNGFHWIPNGGYHRESWGAGEASGTVAFTLWAEANPIILPIAIPYFQGTLLSNNTVELKFTTESERNSDYILVEKSLKGNDWSKLAKLSAHGNSNLPVSHTTFDNNPNYGSNYYRLGEVDLGGNINYSQIIVILYSKGNGPMLYPNPISGDAYLQGYEMANIKIYSAIGQDITNLVKQTKISDNMIRLNFALVPKGICFIRVNDHFVKAIVE